MKKKSMVLFIFFVCTLFMLGCGISNTKAETNEEANSQIKLDMKAVFNESFDENNMKTILGEDVKVKNNYDVIILKRFGFAIELPKDWMNNDGSEGYYSSLPINGLPGLSLGYVGSKTIKKLNNIGNDDLSNQERMEKAIKLYDERYRLLSIYRVKKDNADLVKFAANEAKEYNHVLKILDRDGYIFYLNYNDTPANPNQFTPKEIEKIKVSIEQAKVTKDNLVLFPIVIPGSENKVAIDFKGFSAMDLNGNKFDDSIFSKYDITMVNIWATWCGPCINEMPALAKVYDNLPSNANMISIVSDGVEEADTAKEILDDSKAKFRSFVPSEFIAKNVMPNITAFPTTVFVDKNGKVIGQAQLGAPSSDEARIAELYLEIIEDRIAKVKK